MRVRAAGVIDCCCLTDALLARRSLASNFAADKEWKMLPLLIDAERRENWHFGNWDRITWLVNRIGTIEHICFSSQLLCRIGHFCTSSLNWLQVRSHPQQDLQPEEPSKDPGDVRRRTQPARHPRLSQLTLSGTVSLHLEPIAYFSSIVCPFSCCCLADSQTDEDWNQLYNNLKIARLKDLAKPCLLIQKKRIFYNYNYNL